MRDVVIKAGVYGRRDKKGRVLPVAKGERVALPDDEAARLVALDVADYADTPAQAAGTPPVDGLCPFRAGAANGGLTPGGAGEPEAPTPGSDTSAEAAANGGEGEPVSAEAAKLERMRKDDLEQMAQDLGVDISGAKNNRERAILIAAAEAADSGEGLSDLEDGDIVL